MLIFLDTSAILNGFNYKRANAYISPLVIAELEHIKTSDKPAEVKYLARQAVRDIIQSYNINSFPISQKKVEKLLHKYDFLTDINDHRLLCEALILSKDHKISFVTSDGSLYIFAKQFKELNASYYEKKVNAEYCGWRKCNPSDTEFVSLYSHPENNVLNLKINEFGEVFEDDELKDVVFWTGEKYEPLKYKDIKNPYTGETIRPRNLEQKMALHILQNQNIKVKLLTAQWGSGKTFLALNYALEQVSKGNYSKIVFIRNNIIAANTNDIGFLPGSVREKLSIFARCIADHVGGEDELNHLIDEGVIETIPLSHIRGRSLKSSIVLVDECENMDDKLVALVMSRIEEDSELIFCGDIAQIDKKVFEEHNGIRAMLDKLAGNPLFGAVKLIKSERGKTQQLCDLLIPPK